MAKKVSMDEIAKKLGVSKNTVSLALRGMPGISEQTGKLILETAKQFGYEYRKKAAGFRHTGHEPKNICLVLSKQLHNSISFYSFILVGIEDELKRNRLNTILHYYDETSDEFETPLCINQGLISGIIALGHINRKVLNTIAGLKLPLVVIDEYFEDMKLDYVLTDNICGGYEAAEYLIQCGHRDIGFFGDIRRASSFYERYLGFLKAMDVYGIPVNYTFISTGRLLQNLADIDLFKAAIDFKKLRQLPTAVFCCNDSEAFALCRIIESIGLKVPDDISVMGFDDLESAINVSPQLSTIRVEKEFMGKRSVVRLLEKMDNKYGMNEKILISTTLIKRQSVKILNLIKGV